ncbi:MAG: hypothetical protein QOE28_276 [Solirubrobacteraceae bacterium]|nr:hypothetical protein [Solirubrobacteraceae bacterium]
MPRRASRSEIVGAWLKLWTPPRDVEVPPVPVRKLALWGVAVLLVVAGLATVIVPKIDAGKRSASVRDARAAAAQRAAERARIIREQTPRREAVAVLRMPVSAPAAQRLKARAELVARAETAITADARARARAGELTGTPESTSCSSLLRGTHPETDLATRTGVYDCFVPVRTIAASKTNSGGAIGYPFQAVLDFRRASITWCKVNQIPGEQVIPDPRQVIQLPAACRGPAR